MNSEDIICPCAGVSKREIEQAMVDNKITTFDEMCTSTPAGSFCGQCRDDIQAVIDEKLG